jgi:hypothetical protein
MSALLGFLSSMDENESIEFVNKKRIIQLVFRKQGNKVYSKSYDVTKNELSCLSTDTDRFLFNRLHCLKGDVLTQIYFDKKTQKPLDNPVK